MSTQTQHSDDVLNILALETSGRRGSIALARAAGQECDLLASVELPVGQRSARSLLPELSALLKSIDWKPAQLGLVCVTSGPGSFTGLRIGITTAKAIAYATGASLVGVHTLLSMAKQVPDSTRPGWTILDAQREQLFAARHPVGWRSLSNYQCQTELIDNEKWLETIEAGETVSGPPLEKLKASLPEGVLVADKSLWSPSAVSVARIGYALFQRGQTLDPMQLVPSYYRKSAAEEKADLSQTRE